MESEYLVAFYRIPLERVSLTEVWVDFGIIWGCNLEHMGHCALDLL